MRHFREFIKVRVCYVLNYLFQERESSIFCKAKLFSKQAHFKLYGEKAQMIEGLLCIGRTRVQNQLILFHAEACRKWLWCIKFRYL